jgi:hypothetical protein
MDKVMRAVMRELMRELMRPEVAAVGGVVGALVDGSKMGALPPNPRDIWCKKNKRRFCLK